jgi:hypothetical protein
MLGGVTVALDKVTAKKAKKWRRWSALAGVVLALVCKSLPPEYQAVCEVIVSICHGGF